MRRAVGALVGKDLRVELRTGEAVPAMLLFSVSTFVLFHFALDRRSVEGELAAGVLWVTLLFAAVLGITRLFVAEREQGGFDGFLLAPVDRTSLFVAKATVLFCFLVGGRAGGRAGLRDPAARARRRGRPCPSWSPCCCSPTSAWRWWARWSARSASRPARAR